MNNLHNLRAMVEQYLRAAWRRRWLGVAIAWIGCLGGWMGVSEFPTSSSRAPACLSMPTRF